MLIHQICTKPHQNGNHLCAVHIISFDHGCLAETTPDVMVVDILPEATKAVMII